MAHSSHLESQADSSSPSSLNSNDIRTLRLNTESSCSTRPRHKVQGRRSMFSSINAPVIPKSALPRSPSQSKSRAESAPPQVSTGVIQSPAVIEVPAPCGLPPMSNLVKYELVTWFHELQWIHSQRHKRFGYAESFTTYVTRTCDREHFNLVLMGMPLEMRNKQFKRLVDMFHTINNRLTMSDGTELAELLFAHGMENSLYAGIGRMLAGEEPPNVDLLEKLAFDRRFLHHNPANSAKQPASASGSSNNPISVPETSSSGGSSNTAVKPSNIVDRNEPPRHPPIDQGLRLPDLVALPQTTICKMIEMMRGIVARSNEQAEWFEKKIKKDEENFRTNLSAELERHDTQVRRLICLRITELKVLELSRARAHKENATLPNEMISLLEQAGIAGIDRADL
ncbi:hypothetical protein PGTUg99_034270 [Puccinia graminis f. sp. tritici]|uniref:Uncharacterized protein n=1 Tax=Puccinia graminis f. sp. tritici TaxID=56615 RepID=A0A5B0P4S5_PUCGR|nr:hypothetical protein PGTUg99_034270 [Puccinia graminis f. sp. tritici]